MNPTYNYTVMFMASVTLSKRMDGILGHFFSDDAAVRK